MPDKVNRMIMACAQMISHDTACEQTTIPEPELRKLLDPSLLAKG